MQNLQRKNALLAGVSLLLMAVAAGFAFGYAHNTLFGIADNHELVQHLVKLRALLSAEIGVWLLILLCDIVVAIALYYFFKKVNKKLSFLIAIARLIYSVILGLAIWQLASIFTISESAVDGNEILTKVAMFETFWSIGLIIFGIHLLGLGFLALRSGFVPKIWAWLLLFAGFSYFIIHLLKNVFPAYEIHINQIENILSLPMAIAEIGFAIWLLIRGGRIVTSTK